MTYPQWTCSLHSEHLGNQSSLATLAWPASYAYSCTKANLPVTNLALQHLPGQPVMLTHAQKLLSHSPLWWQPLSLSLPCNALKPCRGTRELPVTNCSIRALISSSKLSTARQNQRTMLLSHVQCLRRVCFFQSSRSILPRPPIISYRKNFAHQLL